MLRIYSLCGYVNVLLLLYYFLVGVVIYTLMSVLLSWTTVMKMPPAIIPWVVLSVPAMLALMEMESTVQVRLAILQSVAIWIICLQNN